MYRLLALLASSLFISMATPHAHAQDFSAGTLEGRVLWNGAPLTGDAVSTVFVFVPNVDGRYISSSGAFSFASILAGSYNLQVFGNGCSTPAYQLGGAPATVIAQSTTSVDIDVTAGAGRVQGLITVDGAPLSSPQISISGLCGTWRSRSDGTFTHHLPPGTYTASVSGSGGYLGDFTFNVTAGGTTDVGTVNFQTGRLRGTVKLNGAAVTGSSVTTISVTIPGFGAQYIGADGRFDFASVRPGSYAVSVYGNGCSTEAYRLATVNVTITAGSDQDIDFEIAPRAGRVRGAIAVNSVPLPNPTLQVPGLCGTWRSQSNGTFEHILPAGTYTATASGPGGTLGNIPFTIVAGSTTDLGTVNFATGNVIGDVLFNGVPVSGDTVTTIYAEVPSVTGQYLSTAGRFTFNGLKVGTYDIGVYGNGCNTPAYKLGTVSATAVEGQETRADLEIGTTSGRVTGRITVNGVPLPNPTIRINGFCGTWRSRSDGTFAHFLPAGTYTATVSGPSGYLGDLTFTVNAGETTYVGFETTAPGFGVVVEFNGGKRVDGGITLVFDEVVFGGTTIAQGFSEGAPIPDGFELYGAADGVRFWSLSTTATLAGDISACFGYDPSVVDGDRVRLVQDTGAGFVDITGDVDPIEGIVCGETDRLGTFAIIVDIDECEAGACSADAACTNTVGAFECACHAGFVGDGTTCTDVDECAEGIDHCDANATCNNTAGGFTCVCNAGYDGDGTNCVDIDECAQSTDNCDANATCNDTEGGFTCTCNAGFVGDGTTCTDIDECALNTDNCDANATCNNTAGGFGCACNAGYTGNGTTCTDIDECALNTDNCDANATCNNTAGGFGCACNAGYTGNGTTCTDIDECAQGTDNCDANATCNNTAGGFGCACNAGYTGNGTTCTDIDECALNTDNCDANATCNNTAGGFGCACNAGYSGNGTTCADIDECAQGTDNCDANATCNNSAGGFGCACNAGYSGNGTTCTDIDECAQGTDNCDANATCNNTAGGFGCACNAGYSGNGTSCVDIDECAQGTDNCDANATCNNNAGGFGCACNAGYTGDGTTCTDIDECAQGTDNCDANATCNNSAGAFSCVCNVGYTGDGTTCTDVRACEAAEDCESGVCTDGLCADAACGDGVVNGDDACDDGNLDDGDGCADTCTVEPGWSCQDDGQASVCTPLCGDGALDSETEACDDGNLDDGDGCTAQCVIEEGWECSGTPSLCEQKEEGIAATGAGGCGAGGLGSVGLIALGLLFVRRTRR